MQKECPSDRNLTKDDKFLFNENQRPLAPSNLRGGANMQWGKGIARTPTHEFRFIELKQIWISRKK